MSQTTNGQQKFFVTAANIAAYLHFAVKEAKNLSLTAKNARVISVRAGDKTAGFRAITDYIDQLSQTTIQQAVTINNLAIKMSRLAVELARVSLTLDKFDKVKQQNQQADYISSLNTPHLSLQQHRAALQKNFDKLNFQLSEAIEETRKQIRSANVIATTSKVEACSAAEFEKSLAVIAHNIETTSENIKLNLDQALYQKNNYL